MTDKHPNMSDKTGKIESPKLGPSSATAPDPLVGTMIDDRYQLLERLGEGGMGHVYRANHMLMDKQVAIKLIHAELAHIDEVAKRFEREARSSSRLTSPHCITVTDFGRTADGELFLVMEVLEGEELDKRIENTGKIPLENALRITSQILKGLAHAHEQGVVHRDLKPENVFLITHGEERDFVKILDFGIAKLASDAGSESLTRTGVVFGTPKYLSPEQALGDKVDHRADLYAVGIILFEMLTGKAPYEAATAMDTMSMHLTAPPPKLADFGAFPKSVQQIINRAMAKKTDERFGSAEEFLTAIEEIDVTEEPSQTEIIFTIPEIVNKIPHGPRQFLKEKASRFKQFVAASRRNQIITASIAIGLIASMVLIPIWGDPSTPKEKFPQKEKAPVVAAEKLGDVGKNTDKIKELLEQAEKEIETGDAAEAIITIKKALNLKPGVPAAKLLLGHAHFSIGNRESALNQYEQAIKKDPALAKDVRFLENLREGLQWQQAREKSALLLARYGKEDDVVMLASLCNSALTEGDVRRAARDALIKTDHEEEIDWLTSLTADFHEQKKCRQRKQIIAQIEETKDPRFLPLLEEFKPKTTRKWKWGQKKTANACIGKDIIRAIETLTAIKEGRSPQKGDA